MAPAVAAAGIQMAGNIISDVNQNAYNQMATEQEWRYNRMAWNEQNAYNHPSQQMARFKEAGLNPNLIYGQGSAGNAAQIPQYTAPKQSFNLGDAISTGLNTLSQYQNLKIQQAQEERIKADTNMINWNLGDRIRNQAWTDLLKESTAQNRYSDATHKALTADLRYYKTLEELNRLQIGNNIQKYTADFMLPARLSLMRSDNEYKQYRNKYMLPLQLNLEKVKFLNNNLNYQYNKDSYNARLLSDYSKGLHDYLNYQWDNAGLQSYGNAWLNLAGRLAHKWF